MMEVLKSALCEIMYKEAEATQKRFHETMNVLCVAMNQIYSERLQQNEKNHAE